MSHLNLISSNLGTVYLSGINAERFESLQNCLLPRSKQFNEIEKQRSIDSVNLLMADQSKSAGRKLLIFIGLIDVVSYIYHFKSFRQLNNLQQNSILNKFFNSPIGIIRKGFWGLNTIARLATYGQKELHDEIGYHLRPLSSSKKVNR